MQNKKDRLGYNGKTGKYENCRDKPCYAHVKHKQLLTKPQNIITIPKPSNSTFKAWALVNFVSGRVMLMRKTKAELRKKTHTNWQYAIVRVW